MKKIGVILIALLMTVLLFTGCSSDAAYQVELIKNGESVQTADSADAFKDYKTEGGTPLFKSIGLEEKNGLFYNSCTFKATSNIAADCRDKYAIRVTMPGKIAQSTEGELSGDATVTFELSDLTQEHDLAAYADSNNITAVVVIIGILAVVLAGVFLYMKRKQG